MKVSDRSDVVPIAQVVDRAVVRVVGRIISIQVEPAGHAPTLTARIADDTGRIDAVFMGRRSIDGIEPGQHIVVEGRAAIKDDALRLYNPRYELR